MVEDRQHVVEDHLGSMISAPAMPTPSDARETPLAPTLARATLPGAPENPIPLPAQDAPLTASDAERATPSTTEAENGSAQMNPPTQHPLPVPQVNPAQRQRRGELADTEAPDPDPHQRQRCPRFGNAPLTFAELRTRVQVEPVAFVWPELLRDSKNPANGVDGLDFERFSVAVGTHIRRMWNSLASHETAPARVRFPRYRRVLGRLRAAAPRTTSEDERRRQEEQRRQRGSVPGDGDERPPETGTVGVVPGGLPPPIDADQGFGAKNAEAAMLPPSVVVAAVQGIAGIVNSFYVFSQSLVRIPEIHAYGIPPIRRRIFYAGRGAHLCCWSCIISCGDASSQMLWERYVQK